jgi:hypothetical protein
MEYSMILLAAVGLTFIITHSKLLINFRAWHSKKGLKFIDDIINCPQCLGLYVGLLFGFLDHWTATPLYAFAVSGICTIFNSIINAANRR